MPQSFLEDLPKTSFTDATIRRMFKLIDKAKTDPAFQKLIYGIVGRKLNGQWKNYRGEIEVVFNWFKSRHDYRRDPYGVELLQDVWATMDRKRFDCDDSSTFLAAASEVLGAPARLVTVSTRRDREPQHVYPQVLVGGRWEALDATVPESFVGWEPSGITDKRVWDRRAVGLSGDEEPVMEGLMGLNGFGHHRSFDSGFFQPRLPAGIPSNVAQTWAYSNPGNLFLAQRRIPPNFVTPETSEKPEIPGPGDTEYGHRLPIIAQYLPGDVWKTIDRDEVPMVLDPDTWTGAVPTNVDDENAMLPQPNVSEDTPLMDLAGLGQGTERQVATTTNWAMDLLKQGGVTDVSSAIAQATALYKKREAERKAAAAAREEAARRAAAAAGRPYTGDEGGVPSWLLPVAIGGAVLLLAGGLLKK